MMIGTMIGLSLFVLLIAGSVRSVTEFVLPNLVAAAIILVGGGACIGYWCEILL